MSVYQVPIANALADWLEAPVVTPITFDTNSRRWVEELDFAKEQGLIVEIGPVESFYGEPRNLRSTTEEVELTEWTWRAVVGFNRPVDLGEYESQIRQVLLLEPEVGEDFPTTRVELTQAVPTEPPSESPGSSSFLEVRFRLSPQRS